MRWQDKSVQFKGLESCSSKICVLVVNATEPARSGQDHATELYFLTTQCGNMEPMPYESITY